MAKNENDKHDHKWTKLLKVGIFACMMLAPLFAIGVKCAYVSINKNAYQSYSGNNTNKTEYVETSLKDMSVDTLVYYTNNNQTQIQRTGQDLYVNASNVTLNNVTYNDADTVQFYAYPSSPNSNTLYLVIKQGGNNGTTLISRDVMTSSYNLTFRFLSYNTNNAQETYLSDIHFYKVVDTSANSYLDNVFYYAVDQMKENELFNWTRNTAIYNGVNAVTTGLGITTDAIPILLVYWILLTLIYVIFDIVIETFTWLTHIFSNKIIK